VVLCIQDTTELDFTSQHGLYAHLTLMATPERLALGVMDAWLWARPPKGSSPVPKESSRWKEGYTLVADTAGRVPDSRFVQVGDRESTSAN